MTNNSRSSGAGGGVSFAGLLTVVFIVLKLTHVISWSWWWVLSPLWISVGLVVLVVTAVVVAALIAVSLDKRKGRAMR